jgi:hypothetical protein
LVGNNGAKRITEHPLPYVSSEHSVEDQALKDLLASAIAPFNKSVVKKKKSNKKPKTGEASSSTATTTTTTATTPSSATTPAAPAEAMDTN